MGDNSQIEWTDATWNPVTGCTKVSQGCKHCYAERIWKRPYPNRAFTDVQCHPDRLGQPLRWRRPRRIFVNSMSDLFHEAVPFEFIASVFSVMGVTTRHTYQVLTKRPERMRAFFEWAADGDDPFHEDLRIRDAWPQELPWKGYDNCGPAYPYENVWLGVSVEDQLTAEDRIPELLRTPAAVRWISAEPLLGPINLGALRVHDLAWLDACSGRCYHFHDGGMPQDYAALDWVVAGGESGPKARPAHPAHFRYLRHQCEMNDIPFCFKQWGEWVSVSEVEAVGEHYQFSNGSTMRRVGKKRAGRALDGEIWDQYPKRV